MQKLALASSVCTDFTSSWLSAVTIKSESSYPGGARVASIRNPGLLRLPHKPSFSSENYISLLQFCVRTHSLADAKDVRSHIIENGVKLDGRLGETLVNTFVKCGSLSDALDVFSSLSERTVFAWTVIVAEYVRTRQYDEALRTYSEMRSAGVEPSEHTLVALLKACARLANANEGMQAHAEVIRRGYGSNLFVVNALTAMYLNFGRISDARFVFDEMPHRDLVAWNTMIAGYAKHEHVEEALQCYVQMREQGVTPDARTFVGLLQACVALAVMEEDNNTDNQRIKIVSLQLGKCVHAEILRIGLLFNKFVCSSLVHLYASCGSIIDARCMFDAFSQDSVVSWTAMISAYAQEKQSNSVIELYHRMLQEGVCPNDRTFVSMLRVCSTLAVVEEETSIDRQVIKVAAMGMGRKLHAEICRRGYANDPFVCSSLVSMYSSCGSLLDAEIVFDLLTWPDVVSWTAMISSYAQQEQAERVLQLYDEMQQMGTRPNNWTLVSVLKACASFGSGDQVNHEALSVNDSAGLYKGRLVHAEVVRTGYDSDPFVGNALVHMYASCGSREDALHVFHSLSSRDVVSWTAMIGAYAQDEQEKAWQLYVSMKEEGVEPNEPTFLCMLKASSSAGALHWCSQVHNAILESGMVCSGNLVTALIHAYAKCGEIETAHALFDSLCKPDVVSWTALIAAYARSGDSRMSLQLYEAMRVAGVKPNEATLVAVLSACSHTGLVSEGMQYFQSMTTVDGIRATREHYACILDLLGRAGNLDQAEDLLAKIPGKKDMAVWLSLLSSYWKH